MRSSQGAAPRCSRRGRGYSGGINTTRVCSKQYTRRKRNHHPQSKKTKLQGISVSAYAFYNYLQAYQILNLVKYLTLCILCAIIEVDT